MSKAIKQKTTQIASTQPAEPTVDQSAEPSRWTFLTNHAHVLIVLNQNPEMVLREVAALVGITERAVQRIIYDLQVGGIIEREKVGRQNRYRIMEEQAMRHPVEAHCTIGDIIHLINGTKVS